jgi:hypothetical protein
LDIAINMKDAEAFPFDFAGAYTSLQSIANIEEDQPPKQLQDSSLLPGPSTSISASSYFCGFMSSRSNSSSKPLYVTFEKALAELLSYVSLAIILAFTICHFIGHETVLSSTLFADF